MAVTFRGLFAYNIIGYLYSGKTELHWSSDTEILVLSTKYIFLSIFCAVVLLFLIIPINVLLLFTKRCVHCKFVGTYLKPFIDAYQAPFKDDCRYLLGMEFLLRTVLYIIYSWMGPHRIYSSHWLYSCSALCCLALLAKAI